MKKLAMCVLALLLAAAPALGEDAARGFEGSGFASPEEAVTAYLQAMKAGDVAGMLSTFAIETYVDEGDPRAYLKRTWSFTPIVNAGVPIQNAYVRNLAVSRRYAELAQSLYMQYLFHAWPEEYGAFSTETLPLQGEDAVEAFLTAMSGSTFAASLSEMEIGEFIEPSTLSEYYLSDNNQQIIARQAEICGCDELVDVAASLSIDGEDWVQCMWVARYGGRWYNLSLSGNIGILLAIDAYAAGLAPVAELS